MRRSALILLASALCSFAQDQKSLLHTELGLPSWLDLNTEERWRTESNGGVGFVDGNDQDYLLQRFRFSAGARPTHWFRVYAETQDSRAFGLPGVGPSVKDTWDLRQAYADIGNENSWWDLKVGRQVLAFGSERTIGGSDWTNPARVFDAVKLGIHHGVNRVDLFSSTVVNPAAEGWDHHAPGDNLHGLYASLGSIVPHAKVEPYVLVRVSPKFAGEPGTVGHYSSAAYGLRTAGTLESNWTYELEVIGQGGTIAGQPLRSWAAEAQIKRLFPQVRWKPTLLAEYNFASGDTNQRDGRVNTFDQLYPTNHSIYGIADQIARRNTKNLRAGVWVQPKSWLTLKAEGNDFWLASRQDALYSASGAVSVAAIPGGANSTHVGEEFDAIADIKLSHHYSIGAQGGHLFPGEFLHQYSPGAGRTFVATFVDFRL